MSHRLLVALFVGLIATPVLADGMVKAPVTYKSKPYHGSLEETSQEAILIFHPGDGKQSATQDMILKISVEGEVDQFGWVVPLPNAPTATAKEDAKLFKELHQYVEKRLASRPRVPLAAEGGAKNAADEAPAQMVEVIERKVVGSFDVAIVREKQAGALNDWLKKEGFATVTEGKEIVEAYRKEGYVFACMKVSNAALAKGKAIDLHPLRFSFETGGRDGIFFPMRLTGLQTSKFDVNLYIFYDKWVNPNLSKFGFVHRGFKLKWRDYDTRACTPNKGKHWANPAGDAYLKAYAKDLPTVTAMFKKLHPKNHYYLTNIQATDLDPKKISKWPGDLWMFPYYTNRKFVPYDARAGGPAATVYAN